MANYTAVPVDTQNCNLEEATRILQNALNQMTTVTSVLPMRCSYSIPDSDSYRDFHYNDVGFIIIGVKKHTKEG